MRRAALQKKDNTCKARSKDWMNTRCHGRKAGPLWAAFRPVPERMPVFPAIFTKRTKSVNEGGGGRENKHSRHDIARVRWREKGERITGDCVPHGDIQNDRGHRCF